MCCLRERNLRFFSFFECSNLFTKTCSHPPGTYEIKQTTMVGAFTKKGKQKAKDRGNGTIINRDDTGIQGLSPKET